MAHLTFVGQVKVDMSYVCPNDVKKMLMKEAWSTCWKKWAAKHEYEELKEGFLARASSVSLLRRKTKDEWTDKNRHVARKLVLEGGSVKKRLFDLLVGQMKADAKDVTKRKVQKAPAAPLSRLE